MGIDTGKRGVIVIDSEIHPGVTCLNWGEPFPNIAEYEIAILNMTGLKETTLAKLEWMKLKIMLDNLLESGGEIYFIFDKDSFFRWFRRELEIVPERGKTLKTLDVKFDPYNAIILPWTFYIEELSVLSKGPSLKVDFAELCVNSYQKPLAIQHKNTYYLPKPSKMTVSEGIEVLLREVLKIQSERTVTPSWIKEINLPGDLELRQSIYDLNDKILDLKNQKDKFKAKLAQKNGLKSILFETGEFLEESVFNVFQILEFDVANISDQKRSDFLIKTTDGGIILVEVKGKRGGLTRQDLRALADWVTEYWKEHGEEAKGLMVLNPYRLDPPHEREDFFPHDCIQFSKKRDFCLMTTMDLFKVLEDNLEGKTTREEIEKRILETKGSWNNKIITD